MLSDGLHNAYGLVPLPTEEAPHGRLGKVLRLPLTLLTGMLMLCIMGGMTLTGWFSGRRA
uniref:Uncharacterized protein n=1 Tax=termite gut metagenome TaxID=433724 RepID=S0DG26_9ZZZZ